MTMSATKPERILITGGLGFQGAHLARALAAEGRTVTVLNTPSLRARQIRTLLPRQIDVVYGSVHDAEILEKVLPGQAAVIHMAAWASVDVSLDRPWPPFEINAQGTYALLDALRRLNSNARIVVASSCEVYGPARRAPETPVVQWDAPPGGPLDPIDAALVPQDEDTPLLPRSPYAATKIATDRFAYAFAVTYGLRLSILRPCNIYGPYQRAGASGAVIPTFVRAALKGYPLTITGGGQQSREFLHVVDLVAAYLACLDTEPEPGETFNVGSGETITIEALARMIASHGAFTDPQILHGARRVADVTGFLLDSSRFRSRYGWKPTVPFTDGLARFIAWAIADGADWL